MIENFHVSVCSCSAASYQSLIPLLRLLHHRGGADREIYIAGFIAQVLGNQPQKRIRVAHSKNTKIFLRIIQSFFFFFNVSSSRFKCCTNFLDLRAQFFFHLRQQCFSLHNIQKVKIVRMVGNQQTFKLIALLYFVYSSALQNTFLPLH